MSESPITTLGDDESSSSTTPLEGNEIRKPSPPDQVFFYPKIAHNVMSYQAIFILGCGCDVKNLGPAMLVYMKVNFNALTLAALSLFVVAVS